MLTPAFCHNLVDIGLALASQANVVITVLVHHLVDDVVTVFAGCSACRHSVIILDPARSVNQKAPHSCVVLEPQWSKTLLTTWAEFAII